MSCHSFIQSFIHSIQFNSLHFTSPHFTSLQFTSLHLTSLHFTSLHFTSVHFTSIHFTSLHFNSFIHLAPSLGSTIGTHVCHTPIRSPGQHVVRALHDWKGYRGAFADGLFTAETPGFVAADPVDPLACTVLIVQPQTILETFS